MSAEQFVVCLLEKNAHVPVRQTDGSAGYDLKSSETTCIPARGRCLVSTGISVMIPNGHYGRIAPRSGLSSKFGIETGAGVIDADYRGEVKILLFNHSDDTFPVQPGDRIAQLILEKIATPDIKVVHSSDELSNSERGSNGFGSTGVQ